MSLFTEGLDFMESVRLQYMTDPALYRRGSDELKINATPAVTTFRTEDEYGITTRTQSYDFIVAASELLSLGEPERGDKIIFQNSIYEVLSPRDEPCFRWSDTGGKVLRIHTKRIEAV